MPEGLDTYPEWIDSQKQGKTVDEYQEELNQQRVNTLKSDLEELRDNMTEEEIRQAEDEIRRLAYK